MDRLYIVDLDVEGAGAGAGAGGATPFEHLVHHVMNWLVRDSDLSIDLTRPGTAEIPTQVGKTDFVRHARWTLDEAGDARILQLHLRQPMEGVDGAEFSTDVTVFECSERTALRIEMGREVAAGLLTPASVRTLRRPWLLGAVLRDETLVCRAQGQPVDGEAQVIRAEFAAILPAVIQSQSRLPLLLVDGRTYPARGLANRGARELAGLVQVAVLEASAMRALEEELSAIGTSVPFHGARLVWPTLSARHPDFTEDQVRRWDATVGTILWMVGSVSVSARGQNRWVRQIRDEQRRLHEREFEAAMEAATAAGDSKGEIEALRVRLKALSKERDEALDLAGEYEKQAQQLQPAQAEAAYYKSEMLRLQRGAIPADEDIWSGVPDLDASDLGPLAEFLASTSSGAIVFTPNAVRSWRQSTYPHVEQMHEHLVALAQAAVAWRDADCSIGGLMDDWFRMEWGLIMADTDGGLVKARLDRFTFEGRELSRAPHLKLDDHTNPSEVGRIYFSHDSETKRFIVDHVGLKLYGL